jgi:hypothetical protein
MGAKILAVGLLRRLPLLVLLSLGGTGCRGDEDELSISLLSPMAVESTGDGRILDPCSGHKAGGACDHDEIVSVISIAADDPSIVEVTPYDNVGNPADRHHFRIATLRGGRTSLRARAKFDDGTERDARAALHVIPIDEVRVGFNCLRHKDAPVDAPHLVRQGLSIDVGAAPFGAGHALHGSVPDLIEAEGLENGTFVAPPRDGVFPIRSRFVVDLGVALESFGPDRISSVFADFYGEVPTMRPNRAFSVDVYVTVGDAIPCHAGPGTVTASSQTICAGPEEEVTWNLESLDDVFLTALGEGTCRLSVVPTGATREHEVSFEVSFD